MNIIEKFNQFLIDFRVALQLIDGKKLYADRTIIKTWCNTFKKNISIRNKIFKRISTEKFKKHQLMDKIKKNTITAKKMMKH